MTRLGCVPYLNAKPLIEGLGDVVLRPPAQLAELLAKARVEAALLPSIEVVRHGFVHVPGIAIASPGPADSVRLHLRRPLDRVRTVLLDRASRSTNTLTRILFEVRWGMKPRYVSREPADAAVTIGDASFREYGCPSLDLATAWREWTGLPFVFALWAHDPDHPRPAALRRALAAAKEAGRRALERIIEREHKRVGIDRDRARIYLTERITYDLGPREKRGLALFVRHARELGLLTKEAVLV
jgi:chorismate dehydratase